MKAAQDSSYTYICTIVDSEGFTVETFKHVQYSLQAAEAFERTVLEALKARDNEPRFILGE